MPVIAVNVAPQVLAEIRALVEAGNYASPEQFLEIAAFNQIALEKGAAPSELATASHRAAQAPDSTAPASVQEGAGPAQKPDAAARAPRVGTRARVSRDVPAREIAEPTKRLALPKVTEGRPASVALAPRPQSERVWGQVNRLFPLKLVARAILASRVGKRSWDKIDALADRIAKDASVLGSALERADQASGRKRDDLLATGLPRRGNAASEIRFLTQFMARTTRAGDIYAGAICHYALADFNGERLGLTESGVELARLASPILDASSLDAATSMLSTEERAFFVRQVIAYVPAELHDFMVVLRSVGAGHTTPDGLNESVRKDYPQEWTPLMLRTHASGVVARLTELQLLARHWEGRNVRYEVTKTGEDLLRT